MAYRRDYVQSEATDLLTIVVGNSRVSAVCWEPSGKIAGRYAWSTGMSGKALAREIAAVVRENGTATIVLAGVVPAVLDELARALSVFPGHARTCILLRFRKDLPCPLTIRPRPAAKVGDDRLAGALGALSIDPRVPWVTVDAGTALTVNSVRPPGRSGARRSLGAFEGGLIVPGEQLALSSLAGGTAQLPGLMPLNSTRIAPVRGCSTEEAIRFGVRRAQIAAACELARAQAEALGAGTRVVLTGGGADALWPSFRRALAPHRPVRDPELVHRGLQAAWHDPSE